MPRSKAEDKDIGWSFCTKVTDDGKVLKCNFCDKVIRGGITRLKEHLAHKRGNVAPCTNVSAPVQRDMASVLKEYKDKKKDKIIRTCELENELIRANNRGFEDDDDDDDDIQLEIARQQSQMQQQFDYDRNLMRGRSSFHEGGSSRAPQFIRSSTVKEVGKNRTFEPTSTPTSRLRAVEIDLEKYSKAKKQQKINTSWLKKQSKKLLRAFGNWFIDTNQPFSCVNSVYTNPLMNAIREAPPQCKAPTAYELAEVYLPQECRLMKEYIASFANIWEERGVSIMCDGWTGPTKMHIINFLVYSNRGTVFHKSVDATDVRSRTGEYYFSLMKKVIEEIRPRIVVQIITDNEAAMKLAGKKVMETFPNIYWTACSAHCIDLMLEEMVKKTSIKEVLIQARMISSWIYNSTWVVNYMKKFTNNREILRPGITRFATHFVSLESIVKHKMPLRNMFESSDWLSSRWGQMNDENSMRVRELILGNSENAAKFWQRANEILQIMEPLLQVLRLVDGDEKPTMGFIYEAMERAKLAIKEKNRYYKKYWKIIDDKWNAQLHSHLHATGYFLNPQYLYHDGRIFKDDEVISGVKSVIQRLEPSMEAAIKALNQIYIYKDKLDSFSNYMAEEGIKHMNPAEWWMTFGESVPELRRIAVRVLSQTTSSSNCERNWSMWSQVHTKARNRLQYKRLHMIVYLRYNMKLKIRHATRRSAQEIDASFNPINLDYIFEDDPINEWIEEREQPVFENDDLEWMNFDDEEGGNTINIEDDDAPSGLGASPPFKYNTSQPTRNTSTLSPPSDDTGGGGNDYEPEDSEGYPYSSRQSSMRDIGVPHKGHLNEPTNVDHNTLKTFARRRSGPVIQELPSDNDEYNMDQLNHTYDLTPNWGDYIGSSNTPNESQYSNQPSNWDQFWPNHSHDDSNHTQIINQGTINYGPVHYDNSVHYHYSSSEASNFDNWNSNDYDQSSYNFDNNEEQERHRHSFWW